jgi:hypothetical protein
LQDVNNIKHLAEMGVVFLLFNIGLELSMDRLASLAKLVFGMGSLQAGVECEGGESKIERKPRHGSCPTLAQHGLRCVAWAKKKASWARSWVPPKVGACRAITDTTIVVCRLAQRLKVGGL